MAATGTSTHPSAPKPASGTGQSPFARLAEAVATAQAHLNNPKAEKTSTRREPVRLLPSDDLFCGSGRNLSRAESREPRQEPCAEKSAPAPSSSLPLARRSSAAAGGEQAASDHPARSAVSFARPTGHGSRAHERRSTRVSTVRQAKNYLRATRSPEFLRSAPDLQRHRRKCAICHHPEREMLEELFIHWHSPQAIANFFRDYGQINWVSIYRHAYALGLDEIRRRNLRHFFENLLDDAIEATPTFAGVLGAARALGCVTEDGRWVEPEKRILMTIVVRHEDPQATSSTDAESLQNSDPKSDEIGRVPLTSLPKAAVNAPAAALQTPPSGQPRFVRARFQPCRKQPPNRAASAAEVPRPRHERNVSSPSSSLPPARRLPAVAGGGEAALDAPATAQQTPPGFSGAPSAPTSHEPRVTEHARPSASRQIRLSPNLHKTKHKTISNR